MTEPAPIACTLTAADLADQARRWKRLIGWALTARAETPDGLRLSFRAEAGDELRALATAESECCPWATWRVERDAGAAVLDVRSSAGGAAVLHAMFTAGRDGHTSAS